jgi:hypothetical protein
MPLVIGIVGLPNVGKSTLFNALTRQQVNAANYPFATIDPNIGVVAVPDERLAKLARLENSKKIVPTMVQFVDIAGLVKDAHKGEGLGNQFLSHIRETDAIAHVVRFFPDSDVHHVEGSVNGLRDIETIHTELILADLETIRKRLENLRPKTKTGDKQALALVGLLERLASSMAESRLAHDVSLSTEERKEIADLHLLTDKPILYVANISGSATLPEDIPLSVKDCLVRIDVKQEAEIAALSDEDRSAYLAEAGIKETGLDTLIRAAYRILGLITFLTTGPDETRAWTVREGSTAPEAAGKIHSDFQQKFIKAETINWEKLLAAGSWNRAREVGLVRTEGKGYIVQDGDVMFFRHG